MIPNHTQFTAAIQDRKRVCVRFYSKPDSGVLDRVCAPMDYGPGENPDGLNRYWLWDYVNETGLHRIGLVPQQILDLQVLGDVFDPSEFTLGPALGPVAAAPAPLPVPVALSSSEKVPIL
jgi:hypothetical protein